MTRETSKAQPDRPVTTDEYIKWLVDTAPPLTAAQRDRLAQLLRPAKDRPAPMEEAE